MSAIETGYRRWRGRSTSLWRRRWVMVETGLRLSLRSKLLRAVIALSWSSSLLLASVYFLFGQLMAPESATLDFLAERGGEELAAVIKGVAAWFLLYPDICVDGIYRLTFAGASGLYLTLSFVGVALFVGNLISQDLSSNAIVIYNTKALTRFDYMVGKFGVAFLLLAAIWLAPLLLAWLAGNLMSPYWSFFLHSLPALGLAMLHGAAACATLALLALAVSALSRRSGVAVAWWVVGWIGIGLLAGAASLTSDWASYLSPGRSVEALGTSLFRLSEWLERAEATMPFFNRLTEALPSPPGSGGGLFPPSPSPWAPLGFLAAYALAAALIISRRARAT